MATGTPPFYHQDRQRTFVKISTVLFNITQIDYDEDGIKDASLKDLIRKMLKKKMEGRIDASEISEHPFMVRDFQ